MVCCLLADDVDQRFLVTATIEACGYKKLSRSFDRIDEECEEGQGEKPLDGEITGLIQKAAAGLRAAGAREVYVFGSAASGTLRQNSDVDMAVSGLPPEVFFRAMARASEVLGRPLDLLDLDEDSPFTRYLKREGELRRVG